MSDVTYRVEGDYLIPNLIMDGETDGSTEEEVECLLREMMERQCVDEELKASDQMAWVRKVNALRAMAGEVVLREIVYQ
ncbi:MAG: TnpV protein [Lachnospiraceae bacterium]|nr:TnpV protein [Lachnospiraceae bacterium]